MESSRFEGAERKRKRERCFELETLFFVGEGDPKEARAVKIEREREREGGGRSIKIAAVTEQIS